MSNASEKLSLLDEVGFTSFADSNDFYYGDAPHLDVISAPDLQRVNLPPVKFHVEGMLPEGTGVLAAPSKAGKSWMGLDMGLCIAVGVPFMGHTTNKCGVLYLALEDSKSRLQDRMNKILNGLPAPPQFFFTTAAPTLDDGLLAALDDHVTQHPETKLIIIDTLQKVRGQALQREGSYQQDYRELGAFKSFMDARGISVYFIHHTRKMRDDDDPFNMISGTNGIMGAVDTVWVVTKQKREDQEAVLHITGRDVAQASTVIRFNKDYWRWEPLGDVDWIAEQRARAEYQDSPVIRTIKRLLEQAPDRHWIGTAKELIEAGKYITQTFLANSPRELTSKIQSMDRLMFDYDEIIHIRAGNGTGGGKHHFYYNNAVQFEELPEQTEVPFTTIPTVSTVTNGINGCNGC